MITFQITSHETKIFIFSLYEIVIFGIFEITKLYGWFSQSDALVVQTENDLNDQFNLGLHSVKCNAILFFHGNNAVYSNENETLNQLNLEFKYCFGTKVCFAAFPEYNLILRKIIGHHSVNSWNNIACNKQELCQMNKKLRDLIHHDNLGLVHCREEHFVF